MATPVIQAGPGYRFRHNPQFSTVFGCYCSPGYKGPLRVWLQLPYYLEFWVPEDILKYPVNSCVRARSMQQKSRNLLSWDIIFIVESEKQSNSHCLHHLSLSSCIQIKNLILWVFACLRKPQKSRSKLLSGSGKTTEQYIWCSIYCLLSSGQRRLTVREKGTVFWKAAEWSP